VSDTTQDNARGGGPAPKREARDVLPASVRPPGARSFDGVDEDGDAADLEFLASLAIEVDSEREDGAAAQQPLRGASPRFDDMEVFRESKTEAEKTFRYDHRVPDLDLGDLLEELNTVSAALRRQKAA
jgi:hypothetical protein